MLVLLWRKLYKRNLSPSWLAASWCIREMSSYTSIDIVYVYHKIIKKNQILI